MTSVTNMATAHMGCLGIRAKKYIERNRKTDRKMQKYNNKKTTFQSLKRRRNKLFETNYNFN